jgi:hypothetical protein
MDKPYHQSRQFAIVKNANQEEGAKVGDRELEDWPSPQLHLSH